jgi:hypothetical protein
MTTEARQGCVDVFLDVPLDHRRLLVNSDA